MGNTIYYESITMQRNNDQVQPRGYKGGIFNVKIPIHF